jgi:sulfur carrier protein ThiS
MKIKILDHQDKIKKTLDVSSIKEAAEKLNINLEETVILKNGELTTEDTKLKENDRIRFITTSSGG